MPHKTRIKKIKEELKKLKPFLRERFKVKEIGIFGSYVRKENKKRSDLDVLVKFFEAPSFFEFLELEEFLSKKLKVKIDLVMKDALKPTIGKYILKEVVYV